MCRIYCSSCRGARSKPQITSWCSIPRDSRCEASRPDWRTRVLLVLTHPTIAYGLLLIGIYGLLLEGYNPGAVLPGVVGALSLLLGLYGLQLLAVNYAGLALMALGVGLIVAEFFMPAFGSLGVGRSGGICHRFHHSIRQSRIGTAGGAAVDRRESRWPAGSSSSPSAGWRPVRGAGP